MASPTSTPKRTAGVPPEASSQRHRKGPGTCTHLTMTRLYTNNFRCVICLNTPSTGWLWRCTQDRELLLEEQEAFDEAKLDAVCDLIPRSIMPRERSPAARASKLSFLDELDEADLQSYTAEQLVRILAQRAHVLDVAQNDSRALLSDAQSFALSADITSAGDAQSSQWSSTPTPLSRKLWMPLKDEECQFKCCHYCRPSLIDRSYISLDEVAKGGIPATAATGFGFHLQKERPVALVKHVKNLGLRPSSPPVAPRPRLHPQSTHERRDLSYLTPLFRRRALSTMTPRSRFASPNNPEAKQLESPRIFPQAHRSRGLSVAAKFELALHTPLPVQSLEELLLISGPPTPMEESERAGMFGSAPLDLQNGVAVTEEAVGLHVPDLITQL